jgi:hypothetical protein
MTDCVEQLTQRLLPLMARIEEHPLYRDVSSIDDVRLFMEQHVFAVWDFMCLLKTLHNRIISTSTPWLPTKDALSANLISGILAEEAGDLTEDGKNYASHFDIYTQAMNNIGANTKPIEKLLSLLTQEVTVESALDLVPLSSTAKRFVLTTFGFFGLSTHELAAAFVYGREGATASLFQPLVKQIEETIGKNKPGLSTLLYYLKRHIELDNNEHFDKATKMLSNLINDDPKKLKEAESAAVKALTARIDFLTGIHLSLHKSAIAA